ncbi:MAG: hypothetical protein PHF97_09305 [Bacteroidales bacterium]|nr:hypothetical protein [Bacteroidales bacterium]
MKRALCLLFILGIISLVINTGCTTQPKMTKEQATAKITELQAKLDISKTQWYDIYAKGILLKAPKADSLLTEAKTALDAGDLKKAAEMLTQADTLLKQYSPVDVPDYPASTPLKDPKDQGKIHKATIEDLKLMEVHGVPRWNYWYNFVGKGDDGNLYMAYVYINHHGTGKLVPPTVFAYSCSADPQKIMKVKFSALPKLKTEKDKIIWTVEENGQSLVYTLAEGKIILKYKDRNLELRTEMANNYSFWYNKNIDYALILPNSPNTGFEETGKAEAEIIIQGKTVKVTGFGEQENLFCGGAKGADYRTALLKYGNEWWAPFHTDQAEGIFVMTGKYKDAGLYINGQYIVPSDFEVTPIEANKSFTIKATMPEGVLEVNFSMWGWDPPLYEHWGTCDGTYKGQQLTNGYCWLEHIPQGGVNASPPTGGRKGLPEKQ